MPPRTKRDYAEAYRQHTAALRHWFLAYGIGGPVLFLGNEHIWKRVQNAPGLERVGETFLAGIAVQVVLAIIDKYADWIGYCWAAEPLPPLPANASRLKRIGRWIADRKHSGSEWWIRYDWPSILGDAATAALFGLATINAFKMLIHDPP